MICAPDKFQFLLILTIYYINKKDYKRIQKELEDFNRYCGTQFSLGKLEEESALEENEENEEEVVENEETVADTGPYTCR